MLSGRFLTFTPAAICPWRRNEKRVPMVAEPKVSSEAVPEIAGGPSVAHAQASRQTRSCSGEGHPGQWEWSPRQGGLGAGRALHVREKTALGVSWGSTFILTAVQLLEGILDKYSSMVLK